MARNTDIFSVLGTVPVNVVSNANVQGYIQNAAGVWIPQRGTDDGSAYVSLTESQIKVPVDMQAKYQTTIQTHNAVSVAANGGSSSSVFYDTNGFDKIAVTVLNDAGTTSQVDVQWSNDGTNWHATETIIASGTSQRKSGSMDTRARYVRAVLYNQDTSAAHVMSAWLYLKV
jgi:hypothetical protein